jgi:outer membrane receptor protein involved in Fe transport
MNLPSLTRSILILLLCGATGFAQSGNEGSVEGTVTDPSGAVIPGATVKARHVGTSAVVTATTNEHGIFRFLVLPVGTYEISAERSGFATLIHNGVVVTVGAKIHLPLTVQLAGQRESVFVSGETPLVETTRSHVSATVEERLIDNLPVNGRNFMDFAVLSPGVLRGPGGAAVFGGQRLQTQLVLDGVSNNNPFFGQPFLGFPYQFSLEVVQEFQVNVNGYSAEIGRATNGLVSVATKSGTNEWHGNLFWYYRDKALNATDLISKNLGEPKEPFHVHQFGGTAGGPLRKNRLFLFANYDAQRRTERNETFLNLAPGFRLSSDATVAAFQQRALDYLTLRAAPWLRSFDQDVYFAKLDWRITPSQLLSGRWNSNHFDGKNTLGAGPAQSLEHTGAKAARNDTLAISLTSTTSSSLVNVARFNYLLQDEQNQPNSANPQAFIFEGGQQVLVIGRAVANPQRSYIRQFEWADVLSLNRGRHALKFGGNLICAPIRWEHAPSFSGNYRFNSLESFGRSLAGVPAPAPGEQYIQAFSGEGKPGAAVHPNSIELGAFVQDEWRVRPNLTFNVGLRYDVQWMAKPEVRNPSPALAAAGLDTRFVPQDNNNFAPRFGFAWSPLGSRRLVVRGGYGLFYTWTRAAMASRTHYQNGVGVQTRTFTPGTASAAFIPAYPNTVCGPPEPSGLPPSCPAPTAGTDSIMPFSPDYVQPYDQHASFGAEFQLQNNLAVAASYLMVKGVHLQRWRDVNLPAPTPATIGLAATSTVLTFPRFSARRPILGFDRIHLLESAANSIYHGLAVQLNKRFSRRFQFTAAYTLGKVRDDVPESLVFNPGGGAEASLLSDPSNARADRGTGLLDARHRFVVNGVWELNAGRLDGPAKAIFDGWEVSGIFIVQSGYAYSGLVNFDLNNDGNPFTDRPPGQARNTFRLPATVTFDPRLTRNVRITEGIGLQFIWEAFNVFNRANISTVRTAQYSRSTSSGVCAIAGTPCLVPQTNFGAPTETLGPRIMQFALKILF